MGPAEKAPARPLVVTRGSPASHLFALAQRFSLFNNISQPDINRIVDATCKREFARRETIHSKGDPVRQVILLMSGSVKIVHFGQNGSEVILRLSRPGELLGSSALLSAHARHRSTAQALAPSTAFVWDAEVFVSLSQQFPALVRNTRHILARRLEEMEIRFREVSAEPDRKL